MGLPSLRNVAADWTNICDDCAVSPPSKGLLPQRTKFCRRPGWIPRNYKFALARKQCWIFLSGTPTVSPFSGSPSSRRHPHSLCSLALTADTDIYKADTAPQNIHGRERWAWGLPNGGETNMLQIKFLKLF